MTKSGKILKIETKGNHLDNDESKATSNINSQRESLVGGKHWYLMVLDETAGLFGAYCYDRFMETVEGM